MEPDQSIFGRRLRLLPIRERSWQEQMRQLWVRNYLRHILQRCEWQRQLFLDSYGNAYSTGLLSQIATSRYGDFFDPDFKLGQLHDLDRHRLEAARVSSICLSHPILVIVEESGHFSVADGYHRVARAHIEGKPKLPAFLVPWTRSSYQNSVLLQKHRRFGF